VRRKKCALRLTDGRGHEANPRGALDGDRYRGAQGIHPREIVNLAPKGRHFGLFRTAPGIRHDASPSLSRCRNIPMRGERQDRNNDLRIRQECPRLQWSATAHLRLPESSNRTAHRSYGTLWTIGFRAMRRSRSSRSTSRVASTMRCSAACDAATLSPDHRLRSRRQFDRLIRRHGGRSLSARHGAVGSSAFQRWIGGFAGVRATPNASFEAIGASPGGNSTSSLIASRRFDSQVFHADDDRMNVLWLSPYAVHAAGHGTASRIANLARALQGHHRVTVLSFEGDWERNENIAAAPFEVRSVRWTPLPSSRLRYWTTSRAGVRPYRDGPGRRRPPPRSLRDRERLLEPLRIRLDVMSSMPRNRGPCSHESPDSARRPRPERGYRETAVLRLGGSIVRKRATSVACSVTQRCRRPDLERLAAGFVRQG